MTLVPVGVVACGSRMVRVGAQVEALAGGQVGGGSGDGSVGGPVLSPLPGQRLELGHGDDLGRRGRPLQGSLGLLVPVLEGLGALGVALKSFLGQWVPV